MDNEDPVLEYISSEVYDVIVIGGGVIGASVLREATRKGCKAILVERETDLFVWASGSNSGIICTGVDAPLGSLERALIRDSISHIRPYCQAMNVPMRSCGSLVCQLNTNNGTKEEDLDDILRQSHDAGDTHARLVDPRELEPQLTCQAAVHVPGEIVVDPWLFAVSLAVQARDNGARILLDFDVVDVKLQDGTWSIISKKGTTVKGKTVVNAGGVWADLLHEKIGPVPFESRPKRGQYTVYPSSEGLLHPIQPLPTPETKGIFVFTSLYDQLVVGPTALEQKSRVNRRLDDSVAKELADYLANVIPSAKIREPIGGYVGIRPGTNHRDYQIHLDYNKQWISVAGIRSTGLTASLGIGRHVHELLRGVLGSREPLPNYRVSPLPNIRSLVADYHGRRDGTVLIHGHVYKVTHSLTRLGWDARTGIANTNEHTAVTPARS